MMAQKYFLIFYLILSGFAEAHDIEGQFVTDLQDHYCGNSNYEENIVQIMMIGLNEGDILDEWDKCKDECNRKAATKMETF